ncbi:cysteine hydrolase family protein [Desulfococcaceae bacterium HSG8]|nr:cysteine hydrolase family protein [Desulfococcaceae bacterium HSG8]
MLKIRSFSYILNEKRGKMKTKFYVICMCVCCLLSVWNLQEATAKVESAGDGKISISSPKTALLIIDIQNDYFKGGKYELEGSSEAGSQARKILDVFRKNKFPVIHIRHESKQKEPSFFAPNTEGQKIHESVTPLPDEPVFTKHNVSSFEQTPLAEHLEKEKIRRLIIIGMQTNVCVLGTVKDGVKKKGLEIIVLSDAAAARKTSIHNETLPKIETAGAKIMTAADFIKAMAE